MSEANDSAIKLFGRTIQNIPAPEYSPSSPIDETNLEIFGDDEDEPYEDQCIGKLDDSKDQMGSLTDMESQDHNAKTVENENIEGTPTDDSKGEEENDETSNSQEEILKKPEEILPCPRCNSMETKFCYFNNYNVKQPRHFCKNCQRYWTSGGSMRSMRVGAGRRKNKNSVTQYSHISVSEALPGAMTDLSNGIHQPPLKTNGTVLNFGSNAPICESMNLVMNIAEKTTRDKPEQVANPVTYDAGDNGDDHSCGSSVTAASSKDNISKNGHPDMLWPNFHNFPPQLPCFPGGPWPYQWSSAAVPPPGYFHPGFPMQFYPAPTYWGCTVPGSWNAPWAPQAAASQTHTSPPTSGPNSSTLGKHSRDENTQNSTSREEGQQKRSSPENCLWVPKTLRIDDPEEAAMSSIWATLGITHDKVGLGGGGIFRAFQPKDHVSENFSLLQANPAALSRSLNFNESS